MVPPWHWIAAAIFSSSCVCRALTRRATTVNFTATGSWDAMAMAFKIVAAGPVWKNWNGLTVGSATGNVSSLDGKTVGLTTGNYNAWDGLAG